MSEHESGVIPHIISPIAAANRVKRVPQETDEEALKKAIHQMPLLSHLSWQSLALMDGTFSASVNLDREAFEMFSGHLARWNSNLNMQMEGRNELVWWMHQRPNTANFCDYDVSPQSRARDQNLISVYKVLLVYRLWDSLAAALSMDETECNFKAPRLRVPKAKSIRFPPLWHSEHFATVINIPNIRTFIANARKTCAREYPWMAKPFEDIDHGDLTDNRYTRTQIQSSEKSDVVGLLRNMTQRLSSANAQRIIFNVESASLMVRWVLHHDGALEIDLGKAIKAFTDKSLRESGGRDEDGIRSLSPLQIEAACGFAVLVMARLQSPRSSQTLLLFFRGFLGAPYILLSFRVS
ncbi:hypothetical protein PUNSTDRAFT_139739 [Punctularia strigosozonata HHB-11173 SS5]|uniref:Uncharacterized protein n=1 Tax=Punctularia strigosozonata (strain HHB-11173) TaxID=741275 RepID=R7S0D5_PUNST|nr:uncharacterized protein PUNSTDRAFT_139739 [Punctularia strigosozonata HHB-11173 SS5]EIN03242.1 hypothetical protein PUNSTDRAFT_139739 [Punctularia strigosozonata HHB-11173 SS5]